MQVGKVCKGTAFRNKRIQKLLNSKLIGSLFNVVRQLHLSTNKWLS